MKLEILEKGKLQYKLNGAWEYVFCYNQHNQIIVTKSANKALDERDLSFFQDRYADREFRIKSKSEDMK